MSKHTAGPWMFTEPFELSPGDENIDIQIAGGRRKAADKNGGMIIARCCGLDMEANARLIAAAPEMLEALKGILAAFHDNHSVSIAEMGKVSLAIDKVEGK